MTALGANAMAQEITSYVKYKINEGVTVEIERVKKVQQYGWDNFEVSYRLINDTNYDLQKIDLNIYLVDKKDEEVGIIEIHEFDIPKNSDAVYHFVDIHPEFVHEKYKSVIPVKEKIEVLVPHSAGVKVAQISCSPSLLNK